MRETASQTAGGPCPNGMEWDLYYYYYTRAVSKRQNELIGKFKMVGGDVLSIRGQIVHVHPNRNQNGVDEIWCGLRLEGLSCLYNETKIEMEVFMNTV